jgi:hypothetical protein
MFRTLRFAAVVALLAGLAFVWVKITAADGGAGTVSVIVEFRDDPAAVYAARAKRNGETLSDAQIQGYRDRLRAKQDEFLRELAAGGVASAIKSHDIKNYDGSPGGKVECGIRSSTTASR